jgi:hypothetical protein
LTITATGLYGDSAIEMVSKQRHTTQTVWLLALIGPNVLCGDCAGSCDDTNTSRASYLRPYGVCELSCLVAVSAGNRLTAKAGKEYISLLQPSVYGASAHLGDSK